MANKKKVNTVAVVLTICIILQLVFNAYLVGEVRWARTLATMNTVTVDRSAVSAYVPQWIYEYAPKCVRYENVSVPSFTLNNSEYLQEICTRTICANPEACAIYDEYGNGTNCGTIGGCLSVCARYVNITATAKNITKTICNATALLPEEPRWVLIGGHNET